MKKIFIAIVLLFMIGTASADELKIPLSCWPKDLQVEFSKSGRKLDLTPTERTKDSWGYVQSYGNKFSLFTYHSATQEDFTFIQTLVFEIEKRKTDG